MDETAKWILVIAIIVVVALLITISNYSDKIKQGNKKIQDYLKMIAQHETNISTYKNLTEQQRLEFDKNRAEIKLQSHQWAITELERYKTDELSKMKKIIEDNAIASAANLLQKWKIENEAKIRLDARNRSYGVNIGLITEHLLPFHKNFPYNPKDARFIGTPIDLIVFDGLDEEKEEITIYFVEIKSGKKLRLSPKQQKIKSAVLNERIRWDEINSDDI